MGLPPVIGPGHVLRCMGDLRPGAETAVHQDFRQRPAAGQGGRIWSIHGLQRPAGRQMGIVQVGPGGGVPLSGRNLRQGVNPLPILEGNHGHGGPIGHEGQLQPGEPLRYALRAAQDIEVHRLRLPGVADSVQRPQALAGKGIAGHRAAAVHVSRHSAQIGRAPVDGHQGMTVHQGGPQSRHAAYVVPAGEMALAPALPNAAPGGPGNPAHIVAVGAGDGAVVLAAAHPPQVHPPRDSAGIVLLSGDLPRIGAGGDHGPGLIAEIQRALSLPDQVVLRVKVVLNGHRAHDPGHIDIALHRPVIPGAGQIPRVRRFRRLIRDIFKRVLRFPTVPLQDLPEQTGEHAELPVDLLQVPQQEVGCIRHGLPQGVPVVQQSGKNVAQGVPLFLNVTADGVKGDDGHLRPGLNHVAEVPAEIRGQRRELLHGLTGLLQLIRSLSGLLQPFPQTAGGVRSAVHTLCQRPQGGGCVRSGGPGLPAGGVQLPGIHTGQHQLRRSRADFLCGFSRLVQMGADGSQFRAQRLRRSPGFLCAGQSPQRLFHIPGRLSGGGNGVIQLLLLCLQILPGFGRTQVLQNLLHPGLCGRKLPGRRLQSLIGGGQIRLPAGGGIRQRPGQLRARLPKRLTGSQKIPGSGLQARPCVRIGRAGSDHPGKGIAGFTQAARQGGAGGLKCLQLFQKCIPLRRPLESALRLLQDLPYPCKAAGHV